MIEVPSSPLLSSSSLLSSSLSLSRTGINERKSLSNQYDASANNNDSDDTLVSLSVSELVTPFITDYAYDTNDIKLPIKLLYEGIEMLLLSSLPLM